MSRLIVSSAVLALFCGALSAEVLDATNPKPMGGIIKLMPNNSKSVIVRNRQRTFSETELSAVIGEFATSLRIPVRLVSDDAKADDVGVEVVLLDSPAYRDVTLLVAPEQGRAELAMSWLILDSPDAEKRQQRLNLELMRAVLSALGVGSSECQPDVMTHVADVKDLDKISMTEPNPPSCMALSFCAKKWGIGKIRYASYRRACIDGWAPAPTNDIQRAVWADVHQVPTKPIKITFDPKKGE